MEHTNVKICEKKFEGVDFVTLVKDKVGGYILATAFLDNGSQLAILEFFHDGKVRMEGGDIVATEIIHSNGYCNFIPTSTRKPFSATGFRDINDARSAFVDYYLGIGLPLRDVEVISNNPSVKAQDRGFQSSKVRSWA